jgi:hypothetical protein
MAVAAVKRHQVRFPIGRSRNPELLLASEVAFGCLDGEVAEQELNLIQFAACKMAETSAGAPECGASLASSALARYLSGVSKGLEQTGR